MKRKNPKNLDSGQTSKLYDYSDSGDGTCCSTSGCSHRVWVTREKERERETGRTTEEEKEGRNSGRKIGGWIDPSHHHYEREAEPAASGSGESPEANPEARRLSSTWGRVAKKNCIAPIPDIVRVSPMRSRDEYNGGIVISIIGDYSSRARPRSGGNT